MSSDHSSTTKGDILVVDDRADNLRLLSTMLSDQGYKVRKIIKGELTFDVAQVNPPDLILLDIMMPNISGFDVCQQLKADDRTRSIPIIFLSASDEPLDKVKAFSIGGEDYITKPFEIQEVIARIEHQLRLVRLQKQLRSQNHQLQAEVKERLKAEAALQKINDELEERVNQRTVELTQANHQLQQLGQQLQQALAQEQELSQIKSRIITTISHEYRTPMAIISSSTGVLEEYFDRLNTQLRHKHLKRIQGAIQHMTALVDDVIFLNHLEFEAFELNLHQVSLKDVLQSTIADLTQSQPNAHTIEIQMHDDCNQQTTDARLLTKIMFNLLSNAIKFSPQSPQVQIQVNCTAQAFYLHVHDAGIGIPDDEIDHVFESFYRASNTDNIQGVGLGLALVKKCLDLLSGEITLKSSLNQGTTASIQVPRL